MHKLLILNLVPLVSWSSAPYREALPGYTYSFPRDHFEHPDFRTEWWYYTGNVWTADGHRFGFELVFFREGERLGSRTNPSKWRVDDLYLAHAALTDVNGRHFTWHERLNRGGPGIAGARFATQRVWNGNWSDQWNGDTQSLDAVTEDFAFHLHCQPAKPVVIHGENGVSQKAAGAGRASHYISFPLLKVNGTLHLGGGSMTVSGQAWMDHEWFTHQLESNQVGWDWFSVQLDGGTELMMFELRRQDGSVDPYSSGTLIDPKGAAHHLTRDQFDLRPLARSGRYPTSWSISIPSFHINLLCRAAVDNQEIAATRGTRYWEGAVDFSGSSHGVGYLEMTGYEAPVSLR